jgi:hypothetical protein
MPACLNKAMMALVLLFFISCNKEAGKPDEPVVTENPPQGPVLTNKAIAGAYLITKVEIVASGRRWDMTQEWFSTYAGNCAKDDVTEFKSDNSFVVVDGTVACDESTDDTGTWEVISNTKLRWDADTALIEAFSGTMLRMVSPVYSTAQGDVIFTYTRQ